MIKICGRVCDSEMIELRQSHQRLLLGTGAQHRVEELISRLEASLWIEFVSTV